jgi:hypothetical protein
VLSTKTERIILAGNMIDPVKSSTNNSIKNKKSFTAVRGYNVQTNVSVRIPL